MNKQDIGLLLIIYLRGPQTPEQISTFVTTEVHNRKFVYWMQTDKGRAVLALTQAGEAWVEEAMRLVKENCIC